MRANARVAARAPHSARRISDTHRPACRRTASTENVSAAHKVVLDKEVVSNHKRFESSKVGMATKIMAARKAIRTARSSSPSSPFEVSKGLLYLLCILVPFIAVGLATNWDMGKVILNIVLCILCGIPGIIHAFLVVSKS